MYEAFWGKNVPSFEEYLANLQYMYISEADYLAAESFPSGIVGKTYLSFYSQMQIILMNVQWY